jgi:hypothetical protein
MFEWWEGPLDEESLRSAVRNSAEHPDFCPGLDVVADFSRADLSLPSGDLRSFAESASRDSGLRTGRVAFIVGRPLEKGMLRMFGILTDGSEHWEDMNLFRTFDEARTWLGLPDSFVPPSREEQGDG